jgi:SAM-dependent methyltransferase
VIAALRARARVGPRLRRARDLARHRGSAVRCPVCGWSFDVFKPAANRPDAVCWRCGSHERHRALWLYLHRERPELLAGARRLLHFAPEHCLEHRLPRPGLEYVTADLDPSKGRLELDVTDLALPDDAFDAILCSHVLEHVPDDRRAMRELQRVLEPGGWCIVMVPIDLGRAVTYEDASITDPAERERHFWQDDHVRLYAPDVADRLRDAGFEVDAWAPRPEWIAPHRLLPADLVLCCRKG